MGKQTFSLSLGSAKRDLCTVLDIIVAVSVPLRGTVWGGGGLTYPQLRCFAACSGFLMVGPASRNPAAYRLLLQCRVILIEIKKGRRIVTEGE